MDLAGRLWIISQSFALVKDCLINKGGGGIRQRKIYRQTDRETERHPNRRQAERQTEQQLGRQTDRTGW